MSTLLANYSMAIFLINFLHHQNILSYFLHHQNCRHVDYHEAVLKFHSHELFNVDCIAMIIRLPKRDIISFYVCFLFLCVYGKFCYGDQHGDYEAGPKLPIQSDPKVSPPNPPDLAWLSSRWFQWLEQWRSWRQSWFLTHKFLSWFSKQFLVKIFFIFLFLLKPDTLCILR